MLASFNENICKRYEGQIDIINAKAKRIQRLAEQGSRAEARVTRLKIESVNRNVIAGQEGQARMQAEIIASADQIKAEQREALRRREAPVQKQAMDQLSSTINNMLGDKALRAVIDFRAGADWTKADPSILWLEGPATPLMDEYNPLTTIAARVVELTDEAKVHVISYFCHMPRGERLRPGNATKEAQATVALITALTRQAMELLLPRFETKHNLSEVRLSLVQGTMASLSETLRLFGDLLETLDMQLLCIIDGLHWLDDRSTSNILVDLVKMLRKSSAKVLLTTTGRSACLQSEANRKERLTIESLHPRGADVRLSGQTLELGG
ncbi:hypothetical protein PG987_015473 [Apiospora arundinis]